MWVTPGASTDSTCSSFTSPTFSNSRAPPPSRIGTTETTISSSRPAARYCCATDAPPPRDISFSPAAARACSSADSIPSVTKWNVVPPSISSVSRRWLVRTKTGWWKGGLSPHQPFHDSSHGPGPPPNMFRPMMVAPAPPRMSSANGVLAFTSPPSSPWLSRNALSGTSQPWSFSPPTPSGCSGDWSGPATKPSIDIVMFSFSLLIDSPIVVFIFQQGHGSSLWGVAAAHSITAYIPVMIFAFLFGLSMDYEVFMLSRIRQAYDETGSTDKAIELGLARTGKLVTSAALILMFAFLVLSSSPGYEVKSLAIGLAAGIIFDATVIRALLVPALMKLLGNANWWMPKWAGIALRVPQPKPHQDVPNTPPVPVV